jgi:uncharacterized protein YdaU (DUF1376 family)
MSQVPLIEKKITAYLGRLTSKQKKAVLTIVKTFAEEQEDSNAWNDKEFVEEMDKRFKEYETGEVKGYTLAEIEASARQGYKKNN